MTSYRTLILASSLTLFGALASCSNSSSNSSTTTTGTGGGTSTTTTGVTGGSGGAPAVKCPSSLPAQGSACPTIGQACEYGGDAEGLCSTLAACASGKWSINGPSASCGQQPSACPATYADVALGTTCPLADGVCAYPQGFCGCRPCQGDGGTGFGAIWNCNAWADVGAQCPSPRPKLGEACTVEGTECDYGHCCSLPALGPYMKCLGGAWVEWESGACSCSTVSCP